MRHRTLPPITLTSESITPLPEVHELTPVDGWRQWDAAVAVADCQQAAAARRQPRAADMPNCHCAAYAFPHRPGGGNCAVSWASTTDYSLRPPRHYIRLDPVCSACGLAADFRQMDTGIGSYEFWGARGVDVRIETLSTCCEAPAADNDASLQRGRQ